jgi:uncharacterized membrane protein
MSQLPLHPMIVHFPIALACLLPVVLIVFAWGLGRRGWSRMAWLAPLSLQALVFFSAWFALQLGERDEDRVEQVIAEQRIEAHEEAGERFVLASGILLLLMTIPLVWGTRVLPFLLVGLSLVSVFLVYQAGHSGAQLVHGAGGVSASLNPALGAPQNAGEGPGKGASTANPFANGGEDDDDD